MTYRPCWYADGKIGEKKMTPESERSNVFECLKEPGI